MGGYWRLAIAIACVVGMIHSEMARAVDAPGKEKAMASDAQYLHAGPIQCTFQNGELRYIRVGDKEIVRRIYFSVRDGYWGTALPTFSTMDVKQEADHFTIHLAARNTLGAVDYHWEGVVSGAADGTITVRAQGEPAANFDSNRIGLCVLFGAASLAGQKFHTDGKIADSHFPELVSPKLVGERFHTLRYETPAGLNVSCAVEGAIFDMEDQRNWGDNSWKAYAPLPYSYKHVTKGDRKLQTVTISVKGVNASNSRVSPRDPVVVRFGKRIAGSRVPALVSVGAIVKPVEFPDIDFHRADYAGRNQVSWSYIPTEHLPDDDTIVENLPAIEAQLKTVRSFNTAGAKLHVGPIHLTRKGHDPRGEQPFGAAWAAGMIKYISLGAAEEAAFDLGRGPADAVLDAIRPFANRQLLETQVQPSGLIHFTAYAIAAQADESPETVFLVNHSKESREVEVHLPAKAVTVRRVGGDGAGRNEEVRAGALKVRLGAYDVVELILPKPVQ